MARLSLGKPQRYFWFSLGRYFAIRTVSWKTILSRAFFVFECHITTQLVQAVLGSFGPIRKYGPCANIPQYDSSQLQSPTKVLGTPGSDSTKKCRKAIVETLTNDITGIGNPLPPDNVGNEQWEIHHDKQH